MDLWLEEMRHLLVKDKLAWEVLAAQQQLRTNGFKELQKQQENDQKLLEIKRKIGRGERPAHFRLSEDGILLFKR